MESVFAVFGEKAPPAEDEVRELAYRLWEEAGRPEGDGIEFWVRAETALRGERG